MAYGTISMSLEQHEYFEEAIARAEARGAAKTANDLLLAAKAYEKSLLKAFKGDKSEWAQSQRRACSLFVKFLTLVANGESVEAALAATA